MSAGNETRRPTLGSARALRCEEARVLLMGYIDDELQPHELRQIEDHLAVCVECRREEQEFRLLGEVTEQMLNEELVGVDLDDAWQTIYRRLERSTGWLLLSAGLILLLGWWGWTLLNGFFLNSEAPVVVRVGVGASLAGGIVLLVSIGREVLFKYRSERYREVKR
ncbi:MAG: zf-HC2 domain-containing protein [Acidobacteriota bacterium]|jgi:predicted anti-sigma-YlaC factor YlaD